MKFIDLFSGIGGMRLGLEQAGHECVGFCEFDRFARQSYKAMYNTEGEWECHDIRTASPMEIPVADLWCFGFPCQDISVAGKQKGLRGGERSGLFYEVVRLLAGCREEDRPRWLLIENVKNLLSIGNGFDFARLLLEVGRYGYDVQWQVLNSKNFGVPQNRERVFIVCRLGGFGGRKVFPIGPADGENPCQLQEMTVGVRRAKRLYNPDGVSCCLSAVGGGGGEKTGLYAVRFRYTERGEGSRQNCKLEAVDVASTLTAKHCGDPTSDCYNGVVIQQLPHGFNAGGEKDIAPTLTGSAYQHNNFAKSMRIRRLTPRECWRLQGFPDAYFNKAQAAGISDSRLYKQAGNAVTANVARAIGRRLKEIEEAENNADFRCLLRQQNVLVRQG